LVGTKKATTRQTIGYQVTNLASSHPLPSKYALRYVEMLTEANLISQAHAAPFGPLSIEDMLTVWL
jgi:hypothetical protein